MTLPNTLEFLPENLAPERVRLRTATTYRRDIETEFLYMLEEAFREVNYSSLPRITDSEELEKYLKAE